MKAGRSFGGGGPRVVHEHDVARMDIVILIDGVSVRLILTVRTDVLTRTVLGVDVTLGSDDGIPSA